MLFLNHMPQRGNAAEIMNSLSAENIYPAIKRYCELLVGEFGSIAQERKALLSPIAAYVGSKKVAGKTANLVYICTHNSRRSHFGQVWAKVASVYFGIELVNTFSGGTEATAFHPNAIRALQEAGFVIDATAGDQNPVYQVRYAVRAEPVLCFSKIFDHPANPQKEFAAVMTCSEAETNCPYIPGAELRVAATYEDPKSFDGTPLQEEKYRERCRQVALECLYTFSLLKQHTE
jgi:arsenate reductase (thioredoxin)